MTKTGFSLIAFLLYLALSTLIVTCIYNAIAQFFLPSLCSIRKYKELLSLHIMADLFIKEIRHNTLKQWKETTSHLVVWNNGAEDIGWQCNENKLERIQGIYEHGKWKKKRTSMVGLGLDTATFFFEYKEGKIIAIELVLAGVYDSQKIVRSYVAIRM
jgi:hypothetical protein